ncbi:hypothetical protein [Hymenobacter volaticus]|uniref:Uncharacterized protein n=1 Tax=Hymenobacter volaticus TaxID=2932254 RepID=A0ABY4GEI4_9BACT|nr:hypothetical protein [Hymenobacter volaticus]UOQ69299.1 hypothetical protein MUN86_28005 [Hymenobacter volaticus]
MKTSEHVVTARGVGLPARSPLNTLPVPVVLLMPLLLPLNTLKLPVVVL